MGLFDSGSGSTLEDVLGQQATTASMGIEQGYAKKRRQAVSRQAATGRLGSGVANYTIGDINAGEVDELGGVEASLAGALGEIPTGDYLSTQNNERSRQLARLVAELTGQSDLAKAFGMAGSALNLGSKLAGAFGGK